MKNKTTKRCQLATNTKRKAHQKPATNVIDTMNGNPAHYETFRYEISVIATMNVALQLDKYNTAMKTENAYETDV